jgi:23S rRNA pseudouridine1911/1915/1917 synthase
LTQSNTNICILESYSNLEELLNKELLFSKSFLKKSLSKAYLVKSIREKDELELNVEILNRGLINPVYSGEEIEVLLENENYIAINKPAGIHGHPHSYSETDTALNFIRSKFNIPHLSTPQDESESTLLYRLDKETSGVLIFCKNKNHHQSIRDSFNSLVKEKEYLAIVKGKFNQEGTHRHDLKASGSKGSVMKALAPTDKSVSIEVRLVEYNEAEDYSLVKVHLGQGSRHQIRCQLSEIGFPILGDTLYGGDKAQRLFLHAYKYTIEDTSITCKDCDLFLRFFNLDSCL